MQAIKEVKVIAITRNNPVPPCSIEIGSLLNANAIKINSVKNTAI